MTIILAYWKNIPFWAIWWSRRHKIWRQVSRTGEVADMKFYVKFRHLGESREIFHEIWRQYLGLVCPSRATITYSGWRINFEHVVLVEDRGMFPSQKMLLSVIWQYTNMHLILSKSLCWYAWVAELKYAYWWILNTHSGFAITYVTHCT